MLSLKAFAANSLNKSVCRMYDLALIVSVARLNFCQILTRFVTSRSEKCLLLPGDGF